ncbi:hypothetical protein HAX54_011100 [Datura stramonium]|uniref:Uncharacterized protein n=1 Tax=Datura stramonium TaxID=4076 RepID=A0ABS8TJ81_DATST|nr:hypothetical protein [Datura stramonium]
MSQQFLSLQRHTMRVQTLATCSTSPVEAVTCSMNGVRSRVTPGWIILLTSPLGVIPFSTLDSIRRLTQSQAVFLEATLIMLLSWFCFCFFARCAPLGDGRSIWFKIRWWISRLDICFASRHWLV